MNYSGSDIAAAPRDGDNKKRDHKGKLINGERNDARRYMPAGAPAVNRGPSKRYQRQRSTSTRSYHLNSTTFSLRCITPSRSC